MNLESVSSTAALALKTPMIASSILTITVCHQHDHRGLEISNDSQSCLTSGTGSQQNLLWMGSDRRPRFCGTVIVHPLTAAVPPELYVETQEDGDDIHGGRLCIRAALFWSRPKSHGCEDLAQAQRKRCDQPTLGLRHGIYSSVLGKPEAGDAWCSSWQWLAVGRRIIWLGLYVSP
ncbi:hypothetical protein KCU79_g18, partial [Aureobasidium melanogenum]